MLCISAPEDEVSVVFAVPTSVIAVTFIGVAAPIARIVPIVTRLAMRIVRAGPPVRSDYAARQSESTCDHDVASRTFE